MSCDKDGCWRDSYPGLTKESSPYMHYHRSPRPLSWERILRHQPRESYSVLLWLAIYCLVLEFFPCLHEWAGLGFLLSCCVLFVLGAHSHPGPGHTRFPANGKLTSLSSIFEPNKFQLLFVLNVVEESMFIMNDVFWRARCCLKVLPKKGLVVDTIVSTVATKVLLQICNTLK